MKGEVEQAQEGSSRVRWPVIVAALLICIAGISLLFRVVLPYDNIFVQGNILFRGTDPYYHMRFIQNLAQHFPFASSWEPYLAYPGGVSWPGAPLFDYLVAGIAWALGLGSPSHHTVELVGAFIPPILGMLTIIPTYFIGKELFNRWVGVIGAALVAVLPGEFMNRTLLGFADHHALETLLSTTVILFFILAVKRARENKLSFEGLRQRDWPTIRKPVIYALLAGFFLALYLLAWAGALLFAFIIAVWMVIQFIMDHLRNRSTDYLCIIGAISFLVALILFLAGPGSGSVMVSVALLIVIVAAIVLSAMSRAMNHRGIVPLYYVPTLLVLAGIGAGLLYLVSPSLFNSMLHRLSFFTPGSAGMLTVIEWQPLLFPRGDFSFSVAWNNFTTSFFISFVVIAWLVYRSIKDEKADRTLFLVWGIIMLVGLLAHRRYSYYFTVNAALMTGYLCWGMLELAGAKRLLTKLFTKPVEPVQEQTKKTKKRKRSKERSSDVLQRAWLWVGAAFAIIAVFFLAFFPNIGKAESLANNKPQITVGWYNSLQVLKNNSPEPFGTPDFYYDRYPSKDEFEYPDTVYSVMSWWDYGYWITYLAHRVPYANPGGGGVRPLLGQFFISQDEEAAEKVLKEMGAKSKYIMIDWLMPTSKFYAMPTWASVDANNFYETYYRRTEEGRLESIRLFYPDYYRSMVARLFNFDGKAVTPEKTTVISYEEKISSGGQRYKLITSAEEFTSYDEAEEYISENGAENLRIVSGNPLVSPIPLQPLESYQLIHESDAKAKIGGTEVPQVKIFEHHTSE
ncbi:MAG: oligosaccharyl transferase, archaeosortase A system-associated [Chloroflexota bacterium]